MVMSRAGIRRSTATQYMTLLEKDRIMQERIADVEGKPVMVFLLVAGSHSGWDFSGRQRYWTQGQRIKTCEDLATLFENKFERLSDDSPHDDGILQFNPYGG
jgi:hypothetical protein